GGGEAPLHGRTERRLEGSARAISQPRFVAEEDEKDDSVAVHAPQAPRKPRAAARTPRRSPGGYVLPSLELLAAPKAIGRSMLSADALQANASALEGVLPDFGVRGQIINAPPRPLATP